MATYPVGDVVRLSTTYTNNGTPTDPTTVTLRIKANGSLSVLVFGSSGIVKDSTGVYHYDYTTSASGTVYYRWEGTGTVTAAAESNFIAGPSNFY